MICDGRNDRVIVMCMIVKLLKLFVPVSKTNVSVVHQRKGSAKFGSFLDREMVKKNNNHSINKRNNFREFLVKHKIYVLAFAFLAIVSLLYSNFIVMASFITVGIASRYYQKYMPHLSFGIETCLFGTVLSSLAYGWHAGAIVGVVSLTISVFLTEEDASYLPVALLGMAGVAFMASLAPITAANIVFWGMLLTLFYDITTCGVYIHMFHADIFKTIIFIVTHLAFNYFVFANFGVYIYGLLI